MISWWNRIQLKELNKQLKIFSPTVTETRGVNYFMNWADTLDYGKDFSGRKMFLEKHKSELLELMRSS